MLAIVIETARFVTFCTLSVFHMFDGKMLCQACATHFGPSTNSFTYPLYYGCPRPLLPRFPIAMSSYHHFCPRVGPGFRILSPRSCRRPHELSQPDKTGTNVVLSGLHNEAKNPVFNQQNYILLPKQFYAISEPLYLSGGTPVFTFTVPVCSYLTKNLVLRLVCQGILISTSKTISPD